jgi:hypothetical protein
MPNGQGWGRRSSGVATLALVASVLMLSTGALGATVIEVPIDQIVRGPDGSVHVLASFPVDTGLVGRQCAVSVVSHNQVSSHPDSDILVDSGGTQVVVEDVESSPFVVIAGEGTLTVGTNITVSVRLGPDERFSGGMTVTIDCEAPPPSTTTTSAPAVSGTSAATTSPTSAVTTSPTSTTVAPTVSGIVVTNSSSPQVGGTASTLPFTGASTASMSVTGAALVAAGSLLAAMSRRAEDRKGPRTWS